MKGFHLRNINPKKTPNMQGNARGAVMPHKAHVVLQVCGEVDYIAGVSSLIMWARESQRNRCSIFQEQYKLVALAQPGGTPSRTD